MNLTEIAARYGTPTYAYDLAEVRAAYADLTGMLPTPATLYYSLKANPHPLIVAQLRHLGSHAEVASAGEIDAALAAGVPAQDMLLTAPGKSPATIAYALERGVRQVSVDSPIDLARLEAHAQQRDVIVRCLLRVNADQPVPGAGLAMTGTASQFGADASWIEAAGAHFRGGRHTRVDGLHLYMGTNLTDEDTLVAQFDTAAAVAERFADRWGTLAEVDLGGGFGTPYARAGTRPTWPTLRERIEEILDRRLPGWRGGTPRISFESGRYLSGACGALLCGVLDVKVSKGQTFTVLDTGIHHLGGMAGLRRLPPIVPALLSLPDAGSPERPSTRTTVVGPLCTPLDTFLRGAEMPALADGDVLLVPNIGAYGLTASLLGFLGHRAPTEVICDGDEVLDASHLVIGRVAGPAEEGLRPQRRAAPVGA